MTRFERFFGADLRSLALMRVAIGLIVSFDVWFRAGDLVAHYSDRGVLPRGGFFEIFTTPTWWSIHLANGAPLFQAFLFALAGIFALFVVVGYRTRLSTIVTWVLLISVQTRNPLLLNSGDLLLRCLLFWCMFLPWGALYSVDRALRREDRPLPALVTTSAVVGFMLQVAYLYVFSALHKTGPAWTLDGTAIYYALSIDSLVRPLGTFLLQFPELMRLMTFSVYWVEMLLPILLFFPFATHRVRMLGVAAIVALHVGFSLGLRIGIFPWVNWSAAIIFVTPEAWEWLGKQLARQRRPHIEVFYDGECGFCRRGLLILQTFLFLGATPIRPAQEDEAAHEKMLEQDSWVVRNEQGEYLFGWNAGPEWLRASPVFHWLAPIGRIPPLAWVMNRLYRVLTRHRGSAGRWFLAGYAPPLPEFGESQLRALLLYLLSFYLLLWNLSGLSPAMGQWFESAKAPGRTLRLEQAWMMFAPEPSEYDSWWTIPGRLEDGREVDLLGWLVDRDPAAPLTLEQPEFIAGTYKRIRWRNYLAAISGTGAREKRQRFGDYLCRSWNGAHPGKQSRLREVGLTVVNVRTLPGFRKGPPKTTELWTQECGAPQEGANSVRDR